LRRALLLAALLVPAVARADLLSDADEVGAWLGKSGWSVTRGEAVFADASVVIRAPQGVLEAKDDCVSLVLVAPRTAEFTAYPGLEAEDGAPKAESGTLVLSRCGVERRELQRVTVVHASRGALEVIWAKGRDAVDDVRAALPDRDPGPGRARQADPGPLPSPPPLATRRERSEKRAKVAGAEAISPSSFQAGGDGKGTATLALPVGCHRLDVMAAGSAVDVDAEAHVGERLVAFDRGESPDATLEFCLAEASEVNVSFQGAPRGADVVVVDARWPLPAGLPETWGAIGRAGVARGLQRRAARALPPRPVAEVFGVQGETRVPIALEPGRCYLASAAALVAGVKVVRLSVQGLRGHHRDETQTENAAAVLAFCTDEEERAVLDVTARGGAALWVAAVWAL